MNHSCVKLHLVLALAFNVINLCRGMGRGIAQQKKTLPPEPPSWPVRLREDASGYPLPGMEEPATCYFDHTDKQS